MPRKVPEAVVRVAAAQDGLITHGQAVAGGLPGSGIASLVSSERWQRLGSAVYATFTGSLDDRQRAWFGVLAAGWDEAVLSHESALWAHGLVTALPSPVSVVVSADRRPRSREVRVVRSRIHRRGTGSPPRSSVEDALCDVAHAWSSDRLAALVAQLLRERRTTVERVQRVIDRRGGFPGAASLRGLVADFSTGAESPLELRYLRDVERRHRLPRGDRQVRSSVGGRSVVRDVVYRDFGLVVELDGDAGHSDLAARFRDRTRDIAATWEQLRTTRYGWVDVAGSPCVVAHQVGTLLGWLGWTGVVRACDRSCGR